MLTNREKLMVIFTLRGLNNEELSDLATQQSAIWQKENEQVAKLRRDGKAPNAANHKLEMAGFKHLMASEFLRARTEGTDFDPCQFVGVTETGRLSRSVHDMMAPAYEAA